MPRVRLLLLCAGLGAALPLYAAEPLKVFSTRPLDGDPLLVGFTQQTGIPIETVRLSPDEFDRLVAAGEPPADMLMTADSGAVRTLERAGLLQPIESKLVESRVEEGLRDLDAGWSAYATRARIIFANPSKLEALPASYEALADPAYRGKVCLGPRGSAYTSSFAAMMVVNHGAEEAQRWAEGVVANFAQPPGARDSALLMALADAEDPCAITVANHYYYPRIMQGDDEEARRALESLEAVFPNQQGEGSEGRGAYRNVNVYALVKGSQRVDDARLLLEYLASDEAQRIVGEGVFYPVVEGVGPVAAEQMFGEWKIDDTSVLRYADAYDEAQAVLERAGWE
ncbi:extracellular solute-binding protein [Halotalea alkalilenta]|uniref:extracellular solute-binding protein n=1 Tax=Halotalea alkalilenta TaxID=376489 RepID=UPI000486B88E|nr:extracellular solute-binding protein [Halotalea alkalilenta]